MQAIIPSLESIIKSFIKVYSSMFHIKVKYPMFHFQFEYHLIVLYTLRSAAVIIIIKNIKIYI